jgi:trk system potassium uptake protein TrkH
MNFKMVVRVLGFIAVFTGVAMLLPIPFAIYYDDGSAVSLLISSLISISFGVLGFLGFGKKDELRAREGFAIVTFGWITFSLFGSLPFIFSGAIPNYTDAFFETMSGFTTTGATILTDIEALPEGILFWRSLTHWLGGMGIIVLSIAILPFLGVGGMQLFKAEVPGPIADKLKPRVTETAKILWGVYVLISALETVLLLFGGMNLFDALCHTFGTMATGGYSTKNTSVAAYSSAYIDYVIIIFMFLAGTNFSLHYRLLKRDFKSFFINTELRVFFFIILTATLIIGTDTFLNNYGNIGESLRYSLFQVVAIITTTGFGTADYESWSALSQSILFFLMFVGGCAGSTGGGMKVMRVYLLVKFGITEIKKLIHPQAVIPVRIGNTVVDKKVMLNIAGFMVLSIFIFLISSLIIAAFGHSIETSFGAVAATLNNIGPGLDMVGPTDNYAFFSAPVKWILSFLMLLGRLELFTVLILITPAFWKK